MFGRVHIDFAWLFSAQTASTNPHSGMKENFLHVGKFVDLVYQLTRMSFSEVVIYNSRPEENTPHFASWNRYNNYFQKSGHRVSETGRDFRYATIGGSLKNKHLNFSIPSDDSIFLLFSQLKELLPDSHISRQLSFQLEKELKKNFVRQVSQQKGIDIAICCEILDDVANPQLDSLVFVSGDGDFQRPILRAVNSGKNVFLITGTNDPENKVFIAKIYDEIAKDNSNFTVIHLSQDDFFKISSPAYNRPTGQRKTG